MTYSLPRKSNAFYFLAVLFVLLIVWKLSGFLTEEAATVRVLVDGRQRCGTILQQLKWIKAHPNDKVSCAK